jgi:hypothetical protein
LLLALMRSNLSERIKLVLGLGLLIAWQNFHPSAMVGGVWLAGVVVGWWLRRSHRDRVPWAATALTFLCPLAMTATPAGVDLIQVSRYNTEVSRWLTISEWLPLWELDPFDRLEAWIGLTATILLVIWRRDRVRSEDVVPLVFLGFLSLVSYRFVLYFATAAIPVWAAGLGSVRSAMSDRPLGWTGRALAVGVWAVAVLVPSVKHPTHLADYFPFAGMERLRSVIGPGNVYCNTVWAGLLIDTGHPDWRVSHDGRYYLRPIEEWREYQAAQRGEVPVVELVSRYRPRAFVLRAGFDDGLIDLLRKDPAWRELTVDRESIIFLPVHPASPVVDAGPAER